jgi:hypothetical protein
MVERWTCAKRSGSSCAASTVIGVRIRCSPGRLDAGVLVVGAEEEHVLDVDLVRELALVRAT